MFYNPDTTTERKCLITIESTSELIHFHARNCSEGMKSGTGRKVSPFSLQMLATVISAAG
jgi:hypothetical protein